MFIGKKYLYVILSHAFFIAYLGTRHWKMNELIGKTPGHVQRLQTFPFVCLKRNIFVFNIPQIMKKENFRVLRKNLTFPLRI